MVSDTIRKEDPDDEDPDDEDPDDEDPDDEDPSDEDDEQYDEDDEVGMTELMQTFFAGENGKNVVDTIESLKKSIDNQNKILMKICSTFETFCSKES